MISLIVALVLAFFSFIASAIVIFRIVIPILPPHPLSKRVPPAEFGLPTFRSLSPADKCHIWLAGLDLVALSLFTWQIVTEETLGSSPLQIATNPASAIRLWIAVTIRQTCLLIIASVTLLNIRMARSASFGAQHWMLWMPVLVLVFTSTTFAGLLSGTGIDTLFYGLMSYSITIAVLSTMAFGCLFRTLFVIKKNLSIVNSSNDWPPVKQMEEKPRPSFATEDIDAIRDGASWITSNASSRPNSISAWSFSTHHTAATSHHGRPQNGLHPSVPAKSSFWFGSTEPNELQVPPVPPLPSSYGPTSPISADLAVEDPFRRELPPIPNHPRTRLGSQSSWLTSSNGSHTTITSWSYPTTHHEDTIPNASTPDVQTPSTASVMRPITPALADAQVLGGYGYAPSSLEVGKGLEALATSPGTIDISSYNVLGWSVMIWLPLGFAFPYFFLLSQHALPSTAVRVLFILSVTLTSPLLALNILFGSPLPIPTGLFDIREPANPNQAFLPEGLPTHKWSHEYKRSTSASVTVVEGRRSGDVWLSNGDAVDGKGKFGRAVTLLSAKPKLSVLPPEDCDEPELPPIPFQNDDSQPIHVHGTPHSELSAQFGRLRTDSKTSSYNSYGDENVAFATRIMIAQRHYSALAQTVVLPGGATTNRDSVEANAMLSTATGATKSKRASNSSHLRTRSVSSMNGPAKPKGQEDFSISPPPSFPLPPTPPNVRAARLAMLAHKKSFSSGFSFGAVDDIKEIDALTAGVLPVLVPGLTVGDDMRIKEGVYTPPGTFSKSKGMKALKKLAEFGAELSSPEVHSTPAGRRARQPRGRKESGHKKNHFSLPSLGLGKEGMHSLANWSSDIRHALENRVGQFTAVPSNVDLGWRKTVMGVESASDAFVQLHPVHEEEGYPAQGVKRNVSTRFLGLRADVPHNVDTARSSMTSINNMPPSAASTATLFEDFEAGLDSGPQAESTPHHSVSQKSAHRPAPPMPGHRHSTIRYIKSQDNQDNHVVYPFESEARVEPENYTTASVTQWSSRAVRPLVPKANKLRRNPTGSKDGLRPLTLLQDRANINVNSNHISDVRPLSLAKKQKSRAVINQDENANVTTTTPKKNKNIKLLTLARSDTSKSRGILRKTEILPDVVVRPPSLTEHTEFAYSFRD